LEEEARKLLNVYYEGSGPSRPPGRGKDRGAPDEVAVNPSEDVTKRADALAEIVATLSNNHPEVQRFRRRYLSGRLLTDEEAREFLNKRGGPQGTDKAVRRTARNPKWALHPAAKRYATPFDMRELLGLADKLSKAYGWPDGDALWFVLTGYTPRMRPLEVEMFINTSTWPSHRYEPFVARITVTAHAWVRADEVKRAFRDAQRQLLGGDAPSTRRNERTWEVVKFVARRMREHDGETWEDRRKAWNRMCRKDWRYRSYNGFRDVYDRFIEGYVTESTNHPTTRNAREHLMKCIGIVGTISSLEGKAGTQGDFGTLHQKYTNPREQRRSGAMRHRVESAVLQEFLNYREQLRYRHFALTRKRSVVRIHYRPLD
jgi:hypothetical protein